MIKISFYKWKKILLVILLFFSYLYNSNLNFSSVVKKEKSLKVKNNIKVESFNDLFRDNYKNNTILIFEPNNYHHECTPGYTKYFIDLGYRVDIIMHNSGINSFDLFKEIKYVKIFTFTNIKEISAISSNLSTVIKKYNFVLVQTTNIKKKYLFNELDLLKINNSIFVFHNLQIAETNYAKFFKQNRVWTLGNFSKGLQVNPHYFGDIQITF